jgi:hypothetical protein
MARQHLFSKSWHDVHNRNVRAAIEDVEKLDRKTPGDPSLGGAAGIDYASTNNKERTVRKFVFLHYGFEKPTPEIMAAWGKWFASMKDNIVDMGGHFSGGREISKAGTKDLPLGLDSITGFTIVSADSLDDAEKMAKSNPYISSIRVYESDVEVDLPYS